MATQSPSSGWRKVVAVLKREFIELIPTMIYFLIGFLLITFSIHLLRLEQGIDSVGATKAIIAALLVSKVVLVADKLPFVRFVRGRPLIIPVLYRTLVYTVLSMLAHALEIIVRMSIEANGLAAGFAAARADISWEHEVFIFTWVFALFFIYMSEAEVRQELGLRPAWRLLTERSSP